MTEATLDFGTPNDIQRRALAAFTEGARFVLMISGRQAGKSHFGARWLIAQVAKPDAAGKLFGALSFTFRSSRVIERKLKEVLQLDPRLWKRIKYRSQPIPTFEFPNGAIIEVHSTHDPDSLRGPTFYAVWADEVAKISKEAYDIFMPTLLAEGGPFLGTTTPRGRQNWVYRTLYLRSCPPGHPDHDPDLYNPAYRTVSGSTWDNVANLSDEAITQLEEQYGKNSKFGRQEIAGEFVSFEGLVYAWDEGLNYVAPSSLPDPRECSVVIGGIDFGWHPDPFAAIVLGYKDGVWYAYEEIYEHKLLMNDAALLLADLGERYGVGQWFADSARPDNIADLSGRGIPVLPVSKPLIQDRVKEMAMFTDTARFKVSHACADLSFELGTYQYPDEEKLLRDRNRNPIDRDNHLLDATGYAIWSVRFLWQNDARYKLDVEEIEDEEDPYARYNRRKAKYSTSGLAGV